MAISIAIIPAAGRSVRMGSPKLLLPWRGRPLIETVLAAWRNSRANAVVLVVHPDDELIAATGRAAGVDVVVPTQPPSDMKASIRLGLEYAARRWAPHRDDFWLVAPADMPLLTAEAIDAVLAQPRPDHQPILIPRYQGRRGHPVQFPWSLAGQVAQLGANEGLNALVARHQVLEFEVDQPGILADLDTPEDYRRLAAGD